MARSLATVFLGVLLIASQLAALQHDAEHAFAPHDHAGVACDLDGFLDRSSGGIAPEVPLLSPPLGLALKLTSAGHVAAVAAAAIAPSARGPPGAAAV